MAGGNGRSTVETPALARYEAAYGLRGARDGIPAEGPDGRAVFQTQVAGEGAPRVPHTGVRPGPFGSPCLTLEASATPSEPDPAMPRCEQPAPSRRSGHRQAARAKLRKGCK